MLTSLQRWKVEGEDWLKNDSFIRNCVSRTIRFYDRCDDKDQHQLLTSIKHLTTAARYTSLESDLRVIQNKIQERLKHIRTEQIDLTKFVYGIDNPIISRGVILKPYISPNEKGVIFISFEYEWAKLMAHTNLNAFSEQYMLVIAPSGNPFNFINCIFSHVYPNTIFSLISNANDVSVLPNISSKFHIVPLYASNWVLPELYNPLPYEHRDIDLIMVANFAKFKRHYSLFRALKKMPKSLKVLLVGQDQDDRTAETIMKEASYYGVSDNFNIQSNLHYQEVTKALSRARASVVLSRREGSCVAIAESLFAGTPAAILRSAELGSRAFINEFTGCFLDEDQLAAQLMNLIELHASYHPREWAENNISCHHSTAILNNTLRSYALAEGQEWTQDISTLCWRPDPKLVSSTDIEKFKNACLDFEKKFGVVLKAHP